MLEPSGGGGCKRGLPAKAKVLEDDLSCAVCLSLYQDPVSLGCGHSFCRACIQQALLTVDGRCPLCQATVSQSPELQKNFHLASIVETFLAGGGQPQTEDIPCDYCLEKGQAAVRTCINCEVSLCLGHLQKHNAKFRGHALLEPTSSLEGRKCPLHDKLLECYCQDDQACICMMCSIAGPHKGHSITTLKEQHHSLLGELSEKMQTQEETASAMDEGLKNIAIQLENIKKNAGRLRDELSAIITNSYLEVKKLESEMMDAVTSHETKQLWEIKKTEAKMEEKKKETLQSVRELQALKGETDPVLCLQAFLPLQERFQKQDYKIDCVEVADVTVDQSVKTNVTAETRKLIKSLNTCLKPVCDEIIKQAKWFRAVLVGGKLVPYYGICVHPTFGGYVQDQRSNISRCQKTLTYNALGHQLGSGFGYHNNSIYHMAQYPQSVQPGTFPGAVCSQSFSSGQHFWDVDTAQSSSWSVGVTASPNPAVTGVYSGWYVTWDGRSLSSYPQGNVMTSAGGVNRAAPTQIRVRLDCDEKSVFFYDLSDSKGGRPELLCQQQKLSQTVYPAFNVCNGSLTLL